MGPPGPLPLGRRGNYARAKPGRPVKKQKLRTLYRNFEMAGKNARYDKRKKQKIRTQNRGGRKRHASVAQRRRDLADALENVVRLVAARRDVR